jgi:hypothetical protein
MFSPNYKLPDVSLVAPDLGAFVLVLISAKSLVQPKVVDRAAKAIIYNIFHFVMF